MSAYLEYVFCGCRNLYLIVVVVIVMAVLLLLLNVVACICNAFLIAFSEFVCLLILLLQKEKKTEFDSNQESRIFVLKLKKFCLSLQQCEQLLMLCCCCCLCLKLVSKVWYACHIVCQNNKQTKLLSFRIAKSKAPTEKAKTNLNLNSRSCSAFCQIKLKNK